MLKWIDPLFFFLILLVGFFATGTVSSRELGKSYCLNDLKNKESIRIVQVAKWEGDSNPWAKMIVIIKKKEYIFNFNKSDFRDLNEIAEGISYIKIDNYLHKYL